MFATCERHTTFVAPSVVSMTNNERIPDSAAQIEPIHMEIKGLNEGRIISRLLLVSGLTQRDLPVAHGICANMEHFISGLLVRVLPACTKGCQL